jgi:very-short-patch-repair endonuclease
MPRTYIRSERKRKEERSFKVYKPWWVDPFPWLVGSSIEKMVMAELTRRGVFFIFRSQTNDLGGFVDPTWEADFLLPHHKIWIEVQGSYWHSLPGQLEQDSLRYAAIEMAGWKPVFLWEFDIQNRLHSLLDEIGVFYNVNLATEAEARAQWGTSTGLAFKLGSETLTDQLKGLRAALSKRTRPPQLKYRRAKKRRPK